MTRGIKPIDKEPRQSQALDKEEASQKAQARPAQNRKGRSYAPAVQRRPTLHGRCPEAGRAIPLSGSLGEEAGRRRGYIVEKIRTNME